MLLFHGVCFASKTERVPPGASFPFSMQFHYIHYILSEAEAARPAGRVKPLLPHLVGASFISLAPTFFTKVRARSCRCSSSPNRTRCAGLRFGFGGNRRHVSPLQQETAARKGGCLILKGSWDLNPRRPGHEPGRLERVSPKGITPVKGYRLCRFPPSPG